MSRPRVILASASPRRRELLGRLIVDFQVVPADVDEDPLPGESPETTAQRLAHQKWHKVSATYPGALVIAGDTVVAIGERQLAKPRDEEEAGTMLRALSGRAHRVITGLAVGPPGRTICKVVSTTVQFRRLDEMEIADYVATGEPMDKAGAYAIQGGAEGFVVGIEGSYTNVVGLPLEALEEVLAELTV
ncbi:MAG TPA: Maf family protein [Fimbriimonadaceae bacterium]|nr:Maf family protein [Fimbriimonadaceae bacterium]HRJ96212.1 Maf family protein [Fimbriimonadaceae bacterium]